MKKSSKYFLLNRSQQTARECKKLLCTFLNYRKKKLFPNSMKIWFEGEGIDLALKLEEYLL